MHCKISFYKPSGCHFFISWSLAVCITRDSSSNSLISTHRCIFFLIYILRYANLEAAITSISKYSNFICPVPFCNLLRNLEKITLKTKLYSCTGVLCVLELLKWPVKSTAGWPGQSCLYSVCQKPWNLKTCNRWARSLTLCRHARVFEYARLSTELPSCWVYIYLNSRFLRGSCTWCVDIDF